MNAAQRKTSALARHRDVLANLTGLTFDAPRLDAGGALRFTFTGLIFPDGAPRLLALESVVRQREDLAP